MAPPAVDDAIVNRVQQRVLDGMGLVVLHSGHFSKIFRKLMGTTCDLQLARGRRARAHLGGRAGPPDRRRAAGAFELEREEMYGEQFDIPAPETLVFVSWFQGGEVFRSGCCYTPRARQDLLLPPRPRDLPHLLFHDGNVQRGSLRMPSPVGGSARPGGCGSGGVRS